MTRPIFFLTDFGLADTYVGVVKAVILGIAPDARIVDLTHDVPPQDVRSGAFALLTAVPYLPDDAVVLAVVDPGVGTSRRPIAIQVDGRTFIGPDNGLLSWTARRDLWLADAAADAGATHSATPGATGTVVLDRPRFWRPTVRATFHGRDLFGPVAAHLARGVPLADVGAPIEAIQEIHWPVPQTEMDAAGAIVEARGEVIHVDRFGNLITTLRSADLPSQPVVEIAGQTIVGLAPNFQAPGAPRSIALIGSNGLLEIASPNGSAATVLQAGVGTRVAATARRER